MLRYQVVSQREAGATRTLAIVLWKGLARLRGSKEVAEPACRPRATAVSIPAIQISKRDEMRAQNESFSALGHALAGRKTALGSKSTKSRIVSDLRPPRGLSRLEAHLAVQP